MKTKKNKVATNEEIVYLMLKRNGYTFPTTLEDIENLEEHLASDHIPLPDHLKSPERFWEYQATKLIGGVEFSDPLQVAAFTDDSFSEITPISNEKKEKKKKKKK